MNDIAFVLVTPLSPPAYLAVRECATVGIMLYRKKICLSAAHVRDFEHITKRDLSLSLVEGNAYAALIRGKNTISRVQAIVSQLRAKVEDLGVRFYVSETSSEVARDVEFFIPEWSCFVKHLS